MAYKSTLLNTSSALTSQTAHSLNSQNILSTPSLMMVNPDTEPVIEIDADLRKITVPKELYDIGVAGDCCAETIYFTCPRYFDGEDLSKHTCIIRCINAKKEYFEANTIEMNVNNNSLHFGWKIDERATRYSGVINFTVQFEGTNNNCNYQWQTTPAQLNILAGLNIEETITDKDNTLFRTLSNNVQSLQKQVDTLILQIESLLESKFEFDKLKLEFDKMKNNVVYVHDDDI